MATLAEIRAKLQAQDAKTASGPIDKSIYPHWNIDEGQSCSLRFLPDKDTNNTYFWIERQVIKIPFSGVKGDPNAGQVSVQVPCVEMWGAPCPILTEVRPWFKDKSLEDMGRKYWKKRSYLMQGFVRENPLTKDEAPENPIRRFVISPQLFALIKAALLDSEIENMPTDYNNGLDFRITKTSKGGYADYSTSKWSRKETALTAAELAAVETYGLFNLADFLPKKPTDVELKVIKEMFEASVEGQAYDADRWGQYFKPNNINGNRDTDVDNSSKSVTAAPTATAKPKPTVTADVDDAPPFDVDSTATSVASGSGTANPRAEDILKMIRSRSKQS